jgi:hypothetical protein
VSNPGPLVYFLGSFSDPGLDLKIILHIYFKTRKSRVCYAEKTYGVFEIFC